MTEYKPELRRKPQPAAIADLCDDIAVEVSRELRRRNLRLVDLSQRLSYSESCTREMSRWLRGMESIGATRALRIAEALDIPVRILVGDETRQAVA